MQQATADRGSDDDDCCGGSLLNLEDNLNTNILNIDKTLNNNKIASGNNVEVKDVNVLSKNYVKDVDVLKDIDVVKDITIKSNDIIEDHSNVLVVDDTIKNAFNILLGH